MINNTVQTTGLLAYKKLLLLNKLKEKYEPVPENVKITIPNESEPLSKQQVITKIKHRIQKSEYSLKNIDTGLKLLNKAAKALTDYSELIDQGKEVLANYTEENSKESYEKIEKFKNKIINLVDSVKVNNLRILTPEDLEDDGKINIDSKASYRIQKKVTPNENIIQDRVIIHIAIPEQPFLQLNVPLNLGYNTHNIKDIEINTSQGKLDFVNKIEELEKIISDEKENTESLIGRLEGLKNVIKIYNDNLTETLGNYDKDGNEIDVREWSSRDKYDKINYGIVTQRAQRGLLFNFVA